MSSDYIDACCREAVRVLMPSGYLMLWQNAFGLVQGHHLRLADVLQCVDLIAWDNQHLGMGYRSRRRGDYLVILQKPPVKAKATWRDHGIPDRWAERVTRRLHPHIKPVGLIKRLTGAITLSGELVVDPAAGSFVVMYATHELGRDFVGCDIAWKNEIEPLEVAPRVINQANKQLGFDFGEIVCGYVEAQQGFRREPDDGGKTAKRSR